MLYILDKHPRIASKLLADKHLSSTLMSTCTIINSILYHEYSREQGSSILSKNFIVDWGRKTRANLFWLIRFSYYLRKEFQLRYNTTHKLTINIEKLYSEFRTRECPNEFFKLKIPDKYNLKEDYEYNLLNYYYIDKVKPSDFGRRGVPKKYSEIINTDIIFIDYISDLDIIVRLIEEEGKGKLQKFDGNWKDLLCFDELDDGYRVIRSILTNEA